MSENEPDRVSIEVAWPMRVAYSTIRIRLDHSFYPSETGDARTATCDYGADQVAELIAREMDRIEAALKANVPPGPRRVP